MQVRLDKIEQIFCINSGDFIPKSRNYECTNGGAVALANIFCWAAALLYVVFQFHNALLGEYPKVCVNLQTDVR